MADALVDKLIKDLESTAVKVGVNQVMTWLTANVWGGFAGVFINPIAGFFVGIVVSVLVERFDWLSYMLIDGWKNTIEAEQYENAAKKLSDLPLTATPADRAKAEQDKIDAFTRLISIGSTRP
jgi:hypothetical protein